MTQRLPLTAPAQPFVYFVSNAHLTDPDLHGDLLDAFDIVRLVNAVAWNEPLTPADRFDVDADGRVTTSDLRLALDRLVRFQPGDIPSNTIFTDAKMVVCNAGSS